MKGPVTEICLKVALNTNKPNHVLEL